MTGTTRQKGVILRPADLPQKDRGGGARTVALVSRKVGSTTLINGITYFDPGAAIAMHTHNCEESVVVLEGSAILWIDGVETELGPNDTTWLPPDLPHYFRNGSPDKPMRIFWTYATVDATRTLVESGETRAIDDSGVDSGDQKKSATTPGTAKARSAPPESAPFVQRSRSTVLR
jgi:putative monooxygenase